jgi:hypothetical protein
MSKVYVGDIGTAIELDTGVSLVGATVTQIKVRKPSGAVVTWTATVSSTKLRYVTLLNDLDQEGVWRMQASMTLPSGKWLGETAELKVYPPYA